MSTVIPTLRYHDTGSAIQWLVDVVGFTEHAVYRNEDGTVAHCELAFGDGFVMIGERNEGPFVPTGTAVTYLVATDPAAIDEGHRRAVEAGADIVMPVTDQDYGSREYAVRDPEGNVWSIGTYRPG